MTLPYQCLAACSRKVPDGSGGWLYEWALFGATGSQIVVQSSNGATSTWTMHEHQAKPDPENADEERPGKRVKLTPPTEQKPNFSTLKITHDSKHLVATTAEDKCIRVFQVGANWDLQQLSARCMARRPSSIALTEDGLTILCADKFGDVYSLPLIPSPEEEEKEMLEREKKEQAKFVPSASVLTVHSGRNRKILEEQLKQAETKQLQARETPKFKHDLLLGHVSMLTDIVCTTYQGRSYIATADRDEHIRISRGLPQAHIIEGFCQGHDEFISRLCISKHKTHLVSGGGDAHLYVWDWLDRDSRNAPVRLIERLPIRDAVMDFYRKQGASAVDEKLKVAVSGIWAVPFNRPNDSDEILVACEGVPALFQFSLNNFRPQARGALPLAGNALDVAFVEHDKDTRVAVVSIDHVHQSGSTTEIRDDKGKSRIQYYVFAEGSSWAEDVKLADSVSWFNGEAGGSAAESGATPAAAEKALRDMLYGVENLRKRPGSED